MDLATVKASVKGWEKTFIALHARNPTKDDIKADQGGIAEQYALYRRLSKASSSSSTAASSSSTRAASSSSSLSGPIAPPAPNVSRTPLPSTYAACPTTPTPPSRRTSLGGPSRELLYESSREPRQTSFSSYSLKRPASTASIAPPGSISAAAAAGPSTPLKRSTEDGSTPKRARTGYTGPIHDPNPINPFSVTPTRPGAGATPTRSNPSMNPPRASLPMAPIADASSPFIHASSPRKLRQVLEANSLRKVRERGDGLGAGPVESRGGSSSSSPFRTTGVVEITPRTRARRRLAGEAVDDTPVKQKAPPRRRRGEVRDTSSSVTSASASSDATMFDMDEARSVVKHEDDNDEDEGEDEFGPSPVKGGGGGGRAFTSLLGEIDSGIHPGVGLKKNGPRNGMKTTFRKASARETYPMFRQSKTSAQTVTVSQTRAPTETLPTRISKPDTAPLVLAASPSPARSSSPTLDRLSTPPPSSESVLDSSSRHRSPSSSRVTPRRQAHILSLSDDETDEWDPEGGTRTTQVRIVPTRRAAVRVRPPSGLASDDDEDDDDKGHDGGNDSMMLASGEEGESANEESGNDDDEDEDGMPGADVETSTKSATTLASPVSSGSVPAPMLSLLSLRSPVKPLHASRRLADLRVRAIFDPTSAAAASLKAARRGQDVFVSGQGGDDDDDERTERELLLLAADDLGVIVQYGDDGGDDDWESECEGWKESAVGGDNDEW